MSKDPAVLFYTSDFLSGTMTMSNEHLGMYIRLLCLQHQTGRLREKDMLSICKAYVEDVYCKFVKDSQGMFYNERMENESLRRQNYSNSRKTNALGSKIKDKPTEAYAQHMENENENENKDKDIIDNKIDRGYGGKEEGFGQIEKRQRFDLILKKYPNRDGSDKAWAFFEATVNYDHDWQDINKALKNYLQTKAVENGYIKSCANWFKCWRDFIEVTTVDFDPTAKWRSED